MTAMPLVKICGITRSEDAEHAVRAGADWLGLNFWPRSKRHVDRSVAAEVATAARRAAQARSDGAGLALVGVFVNQPLAEIAEIAATVGLDLVQLHGDESPADCRDAVAAGLSIIKALTVTRESDIDSLARFPCKIFLIDTPDPGYGGSGRTCDWTLASAAVVSGARIVLAGGLTPDNVARAVAEVRPYAVDVASGVEEVPGRKDPDKISAFIRAAKRVATTEETA